MDSKSIQTRLQWAMGFTLLIFLAEVAGGILANSLALLSDAAHMFMDGFALVVTWAALKFAQKPSTWDKTFGYHRLETLAALLNGFFLFLMACGILYEAVHRFDSPPEVDSKIIVLIGSIGLLANLGVLYLLKNPFHNTRDLNLKGAFYHVLGDFIASIGVIVGGTVIWVTGGWYIVDAIVGAGISLLLFWGAKRIVWDAVHILLEGVPKGISTQEVKLALQEIPEVQDIHELHIWCICSNIYALSVHALVADQAINMAQSILSEIQNLLRDKFNITHATVQFECMRCPESEGFCDMAH